jgi:hypothetical protein
MDTPTPDTSQTVTIDLALANCRTGRVATKVVTDIAGLLAEKWPDIDTAMEDCAIAKAVEDPESDKPATFRLAIGVAITPSGPGYAIKTDLAWTVRHKATVESEVDDGRQPTLPMVEGK